MSHETQREPPQEPPRVDDSLDRDRTRDRKLVAGLAWTGAARWGAQAITWVATILLARLLTPEDFGIWVSAGVYFGIITLLSEFGIGASVVMLRDLTTRQISQINGLAVVTGIAATILSWLAAPAVAAFYDEPAVAPVIVAMSAMFLISAFRIVPMSLLQRDLRFRVLAGADAVKAILQSLMFVGLAWAGFRYWTFPIGAIIAETAWTSMILLVRRHPLAVPRFREIRNAISFSTDIVISRLSWYGYANSDFAIAGRLLGQDALGAYGMAWNMGSLPVEKVNSIIMSVTPAFFSAVQDRKDELRRYVTTLTAGISLVAFPAGIGLALVTDDFVRGLLGPEWEAAILPMRLLALYAAVRAIGPILTPVLNAIGETRFAMWNNVLALAVLPVTFIIGSRWGIGGIAAGWIVVHPLILFLVYQRVAARIELPATDYLRALWPAASGVAVMAAVVIAVGALVPAWAPTPRLIVEVVAGAISYVGIIAIFHRERMRSAIRLVRATRDPGTPSPVSS
ncbi:MAG TPA: lipopolysaccharide biosynthesis protein [Longimicrobiales bacterium]|nr:lipopolysaccharide biosynthesis protein [Longimicrobiales bacterium]